MNKQDLIKILEQHELWLQDDSQGERANLRGANLRDANLQRADLQRANLDYSCMPLWCGDLKADYDDKHIIQQGYHFASHIKNSNNCTDEDLKALLKSELFLKVVNKFHRIEECGRI